MLVTYVSSEALHLPKSKNHPRIFIGLKRVDEHYPFSCFTGMYGRLSKSKSNAFINYPPETK